MLKIVSIVGARPQFIKYFTISRAIDRFNQVHGKTFEDILIHTGQHYDYVMSKIFFDELGIKPPNYHLGVGSGTHGAQTGQIIEKTEAILMELKPDIVIVYGDTNTTLGGALSASKLHIPVAHVESGLRSYNRDMPEEINRILTDYISTLLLCPSKNAINNLKKEGFTSVVNNGEMISDDYKIDYQSLPLIVNVGDVMYDLLLFSLNIASRKSYILKELSLSANKYNVLTIHRAENTDDPQKLKKLINFAIEASSNNKVIFPAHPRTSKILDQVLRKKMI